MKKNTNNLFTLFLLFAVTVAFLGQALINVMAQNVIVGNDNGSNYIIVQSGNSVLSRIPSSRPQSNFPDVFQNNYTKDNAQIFNWALKFSIPGKFFKDVSFANLQTGYIVTELGAVYKTTNGGDNWTEKMNLGFPYYWYGVHALSPDTVIISGFNNQSNIRTGVVRWSFNGGNTWTNDIVLWIPNGVGWTSRVHFFDANKGVVSAEISGGMHYTTNGGKDSSSWTYVQVNSDLGWFAGNIDCQPNGVIYTTGIHLAKSTNYGINWVSGNSADNVFDGGVDFLDNNNLKGWTGGGQISSPVSGWIHRTTDGGVSWGPRLNVFPYPIRAVKFFNDTLGFALGGNNYQDVGAIYVTTNAGTNWNIDVNTSAEMFSIDYKQVNADSTDVWCVGSTGSGSGYTGKLYKARLGIITGIKKITETIPSNFILYQNYPNPFNPSTNIKFSLPPYKRVKGDVTLKLYNILGGEIALLVNEQFNPGTYEIKWDASGYPTGIYFYKLSTENFSETKKMILIK
jgi:photosystem II stability/assembly factor-like uncharacterized protein